VGTNYVLAEMLKTGATSAETVRHILFRDGDAPRRWPDDGRADGNLARSGKSLASP